MKLYAPNYYSLFRCIAGECKHSCCIGWDIYIDKDTLESYGEYADRLVTSEEGTCFALREDGRCPFLNSDGLCDIIIERGEDSLCEICREHPRFYSFFSDRTEVGLGMSCEEAARIILTQKDRTELVYADDDGDEEYELYPEEEYVLEQREIAFDMLQDRAYPTERRAEALRERYAPFFKLGDMKRWQRVYASLEMLEPSWSDKLCGLTAEGELDPSLDTPLEKLLIYLVWRHTSTAADAEDFSVRVAFAYLSYAVIRQIAVSESADLQGLIDIARRYSAEIEYSEENTESVMERIRKTVKKF